MAFQARALRNISRTLLRSFSVQPVHSTNLVLPRPAEGGANLTLPKARYGGRQRVTVIAGDGIGPELIGFVKQAFGVLAVPVDFEDVPLNKVCCSDDHMSNAIASVRRNGVALKGNLETEHKLGAASNTSRNVELRVKLNLFSSVMHVKSFEGVQTRHKNLDLILVRENMEGEYSGLEHETIPGIVESLKLVTRSSSIRIAEFAFELCRLNGRKKLTIVHKANIMKLGDGLFLQCAQEVGKRYPNIKVENMIIDNCTMQLVSKPSQFDVLLMPNLYGNIVSNILSGLVGSPGLTSGQNLGNDYAVFETGTRSSGAKLAGKHTANPTSMLLAACDMLNYVGLPEYAVVLDSAIRQVLNDKRAHTLDLGGTARNDSSWSCSANSSGLRCRKLDPSAAITSLNLAVPSIVYRLRRRHMY